MALFKVAAHTGDNNNGYISYDTDTKQVNVRLNDDVLDAKLYEYLTTVQSLHRYTDLSLYETVNVIPASSLEALKLSLGYVWLSMGIHIDWSRPIELM
ncbi:MAG: hypothetical protein LKF74_05330 [Megasphaera sp.]|nr:hypothetical protein [Megasphaera sp.]MCH4188125.1 hypothetical protein [Megasphaera sp.]MCH4217963.1 hypothetical protein [Megasphaera sp.]